MNFEAIICSPQRGSSPVLKIPNDWHVFFSPHFFHFGWILRNYQACRVQTCMLESRNLYNMAYSPRHFNSRASTSIQILISILTTTSKSSKATSVIVQQKSTLTRNAFLRLCNLSPFSIFCHLPKLSPPLTVLKGRFPPFLALSDYLCHP